jgi:hypothetical protein
VPLATPWRHRSRSGPNGYRQTSLIEWPG